MTVMRIPKVTENRALVGFVFHEYCSQVISLTRGKLDCRIHSFFDYPPADPSLIDFWRCLEISPSYLHQVRNIGQSDTSFAFQSRRLFSAFPICTSYFTPEDGSMCPPEVYIHPELALEVSNRR